MILPVGRSVQGRHASTGRLLATLVVLLAAVAALATVLSTGGAGPELVANMGTALLAVAAAALAWRTALRGEGPLRSAWRRIALGMTCIGVGEVSWLVMESVVGGDTVPSVGDPFFLLSYPLLLAGLAAYPPRPKDRIASQKLWLDAATVTIAGGMLLWYALLYGALSGMDGSVLERTVATAYPIGGLALMLGAAALVLRRPPRALQRVALLLLGAVVLQFAADMLMLAGTVAGGYETGGLADVLWLLAYASVGLAACLQRPQCIAASDVEADRLPPALAQAVPHAAVAIGYGLLIYVALGRGDGELLGLVSGGVALTLVMAARQLIAVRESLRMQRDSAVRSSEAKFRALVRQSSDVVQILDRAGRVCYASPAAARVLGYEPDTLIGSRYVDYLHDDDVAGFTALLAAPSDAAICWQFRHADGRWRLLESVGTDLFLDPAVRGFVINSRDITDRHQLEERLRQSQKLEAVGRLAGGVAHDFNNLLTAIRGHAYLLREHVRPGTDADENLRAIAHASSRAAALVRQLLSYSRKQALRPQVLEPSRVVAETGRMLGRIIGETLEIRFDLADDAGNVEVDPSQLEQVLMNLAVNARDAMPSGGTLTFRTRALEITEATRAHAPLGARAGRFTAIEVADTGCGMDAALLEHIFEPFFTTKEPGRGTGLGLATVYGIVDECGGWVGVESEPGRGTCFTIALPRVDLPASPAVAEPPFALLSGRPHFEVNILVVEDEAAVRTLTERVLRRAGYTVWTAAHGAEALERMQEVGRPIDVLVTDMVMPGMNGAELAIRVCTRQPDTAVLYMSGYAEADIADALAPGVAAAYIEKPFSPEELTRQVAALLALQPA